MNKIFLSCVLVTAPAVAFASGNVINDSFNSAKKILERQVYYGHHVTIYCGAKFDPEKRLTLPMGFSAPAHENRATQIEWEHAVPAENLGRAFSEWRVGHPKCINRKGNSFKGRRCAEKINKEYRYMQADMYNLFPAIGAVNAVRNNKQYSTLPDSVSSFGSCPVKVDGGRFEPPDKAKGQVARASLYMGDAYRPCLRLSRQQRRLFMAWDKQFPVSEWECRRTKRIEAIQRNTNKFVKGPCQRFGLW